MEAVFIRNVSFIEHTEEVNNYVYDNDIKIKFMNFAVEPDGTYVTMIVYKVR